MRDARTPARGTDARGGAGTLLLVEDDVALRRLFRRVLEREGYAVLVAGSGEEAQRLCAQHEGSIDLLLTDMMLPRIEGRVLAERLRRARPGLGVIFMSGYADADFFRGGVLPPGAHFLQKPFPSKLLAGTVREVLSRLAPGSAPAACTTASSSSPRT